MAKDIVILLDGTSNEISTNRTNILRLYGTLCKSDTQVVYYDPGVGTFGGENAISQTYRKGVEIWGMATGWGLDTNVKEAYRFLVENYDRTAGDRIHLFGFSRGAYCARILAAFLHTFGLMESRNLNLLNYAYKAYKRIDTTKEPVDLSELGLYRNALRPHRPTVRFLGLFDTVASVIEWGRYFYRVRNHGFTELNPSVETLRHAVAIDERRRMFRPQLWPEGRKFDPTPDVEGGARAQDAREVWFTGVHGDIGGGYPEPRSGLAKYPLLWMIREATEAGLEFNDAVVRNIVLGEGDPPTKYSKPRFDLKVSRSMTAGWEALELLPGKTKAGSNRQSLLGWSIPLGENRYIPPGVRLHQSVVDRYEAQGPWPPHLPTSYKVET